MGLDMYAYTLATAPSSPVDFETVNERELFYWRKHPNLHGWMEKLYRLKGGQKESFNSVNVVLKSADIDQLEEAVRKNRLPFTTGFFFGQSLRSDKKLDLKFIALARAAIKQGLTVFYTSWW